MAGYMNGYSAGCGMSGGYGQPMMMQPQSYGQAPGSGAPLASNILGYQVDKGGSRDEPEHLSGGRHRGSAAASAKRDPDESVSEGADGDAGHDQSGRFHETNVSGYSEYEIMNDPNQVMQYMQQTRGITQNDIANVENDIRQGGVPWR